MRVNITHLRGVIHFGRSLVAQPDFHFGGSRGILPRENFEIWSPSMAISRVSGVRFVKIFGEGFAIGSNMGSHFPPVISTRISSFYSAVLQPIAPRAPPFPPLSTPLLYRRLESTTKQLYITVQQHSLPSNLFSVAELHAFRPEDRMKVVQPCVDRYQQTSFASD